MEGGSEHPENIWREWKSEDFEIQSSTDSHFNTEPVEQLHSMWQMNHEKLSGVLKELQPPYFGWHGTGRDEFEKIERGRDAYIEVATFYDKAYESPSFIYQLCEAAKYVSRYATGRRNRLGGMIMILNLEEAGKQRTYEWEHLKSFSSGLSSLAFQTASETAEFKKLGDTNNTLSRSDCRLQPDIYSELVVGSINLSEGEWAKYLADLRCPGNEVIARSIIRDRVFAQNIVSETLKALAMNMGKISPNNAE